jgi:hypothetical protein
MMRRILLLSAIFVLAPAAAKAQVEIGIEAGIQLDDRPVVDNVFQLSVPRGLARIGFSGETLTFESLFSFDIRDGGGDTVTLLNIMPGLNLPFGDQGAYVRGEVPMQLVSGGGDTETDFGLGAAVGIKRAIDGGPVSTRFEFGYDRLFDAELNSFRVLFGLGVLVGG